MLLDVYRSWINGEVGARGVMTRRGVDTRGVLGVKGTCIR